MKLARTPNSGRYGRSYQCVFGGLNENPAARDGEIAAMENMSSDCYPLLASRSERYLARTLTRPHGMAARDRLCWVDGTDFYYDGVKKGEVTEGDKRFYFINRWIVIWPDKLYYNTATDKFGSLEASVSVDGEIRRAVFISSTAPMSGISSEANCLVTNGRTVEGVFRPGDAVTISGCKKHPENNVTLVVREATGMALYFYDNSLTLDVSVSYDVGEEGLAAGWYTFLYKGAQHCFELTHALVNGDSIVYNGDDGTYKLTITSGGATERVEVVYGGFGDTRLEFRSEQLGYSETVEVTVSRNVPDLDFLCECDNRLWGVKDSTVYCSCLGDPRVWYNYDGTSTCAWSVEVGSGGGFTGAYAYGGYPLLFKEDHIYRVYGTKPSNFQLMDTVTLGCEAGSEKSFAVVGQTLYYKSRAGFAAYAGGVPSLIDAALGTKRRENAVAGTDGRKYYVSVSEPDGRSLYVYDATLSLWHREDTSDVIDFAWCGGELYMLLADGGLWQTGRVRTPAGTQEGQFVSMAELADFYDGTVGRKTVAHLYFRVQTEGELRLLVSYDGGDWQEAGRVTAGDKAVQTIHLIPRRCDSFRVRLAGHGGWKLWALSREFFSGSTRG